MKDFNEIKNLQELGRYLKDEREKSGTSLEQMQKDTKIRYKYLQSIEEGNFSVLPGGSVYTLGFLKNYARAINLDEHKIIEKYKQISERDLLPPKEPQKQEKEYQDKIIIDIKLKDKHKKLIILGVGIFLLFYMVFICSSLLNSPAPEETQISSGNEQQMEQHEEFPDDSLPATSDDLEPKQPTQPEIEVIENSTNKTVYLVKNDKLEVSIEAVSGRCWIRVLTDGNFQYEETIHPGDVRTITGEQQVFIRIGNPGALNIAINNIDIDIPGGNPRDIIFERGD